MNKIKTLIVDDEKLARRAVRALLEKDSEVTVVGEARDGEEAHELLPALQPDLMFLDVQMPVCDGFELLARLPAAQRPQVVFVTAFDQHAIRAFDLHAVDYLVKPFSNERFSRSLERAKSRARGVDIRTAEKTLARLLEHLRTEPKPGPAAGAANTPPPSERIVVKADGEMHFIEQKDIRWVEGQGDFVKLHTLKQGVLTRMTMQRVADQLDPARFLRIHKSSIVNLGFVRRLKPVMARSLGVELDDGTVLPVGRSYRPALERVL
jgi:two-component system LytT family response regulator